MFPKILQNRSGFALIFVFFFVVLVAGIVIAYLDLNSQGAANSAFKQKETQAFYSTEAAQVRAVQYLQNNWSGIWATIQPAAGNLGTFGPQTENLAVNSAVSYDFIVDNWNLADSTKAAPFGIASITSNVAVQGGNVPANAVDAAMGSNWRTINNPGPLVQLVLQFPNGSNYALNVIHVRRQGAAAAGRPTTYTWSTSPDGVTYTVHFTRLVDSGTNQWYDIFPAVATNVNYVRLDATGWSGNRVQISEIEIPWIRIRSRCRINSASGASFTEKYIRSCVLSSSQSAPATISRVLPSTLANTNITSIWDEIPSATYNNAARF